MRWPELVIAVCGVKKFRDAEEPLRQPVKPLCRGTSLFWAQQRIEERGHRRLRFPRPHLYPRRGDY
jgi:hypothetical protein